MRINNVALGMTAIVLGMSVNTHANATDLPYNYVEGNYFFNAKAKGVGVRVKGDGFGVAGSVEVAPNWLVVGEISQFALDNGQNIDYFMVGGGWVNRISSDLDFVATAQFGREKISGFSGDTGYRMAAGVRAIVAPRVEAFGRFAFENFDGSGSFIEGGAMYSFTDQLSIGGKARFGGGLRHISVQGRYSF